jgi:hypothetical protein
MKHIIENSGRKELKNISVNSLTATETTGGINNNGWRRFRKSGTIPQAILNTLRQSGIIKQDAWIFEGGTTVGELLDFLKCYPYESEQARLTGDYIFRQIFNTDMPSQTKTFVRGENA